MPKLLILSYGAETPMSTLVESCAEGARSVRFTEVDVRDGAGEGTPTIHSRQRLTLNDHLHVYDGVILVAPTAGEVPAKLRALLDQLAMSDPRQFSNTVFGIAGGGATSLLGGVARLGGIIVVEPPGLTDPSARARELGSKVATVVAWVRHALSHEHSGDGTHHSHEPRDTGHRHAH